MMSAAPIKSCPLVLSKSSSNQTCCSRLGSSQRSLASCSGSHVRVQAGKSEEDPVDWDSAWTEFKKNNIDETPEGRTKTTTEPPKFARRRVEWNTGPQREDIRKTEKGLLNVWTQQNFFQAGGVLVIILLVVMILGAGPPPTDSRCTLPWC